MAFSRFFPVILLCLPGFLTGQCGVSVDAGPDLVACASGGTVDLLGSIAGPNLVGFRWSPSSGLSDPEAVDPTATVSGPATYTLTAQVFDPGNNLITNGDFSAGATGFTTDYDPGSGGSFGLLSGEGQYVVSTNSSLTHNNFSNCGDHTGGGAMLVVNGSAVPDERVWCQTVAVTPNTLHVFNAWLQSVHPANPARLQFSVNGILLGNDFRAANATCNWRRFDEVWDAGSATSAEICVINQNTQPSGNDFAIDDLFFGPVCEQSDEVSITVASVEANAPATLFLPCDIPATGYTIDASASSGGTNYFYSWTTADGNILSGAGGRMPRINAPGTYELEVSYDDGINFCSDRTTVLVSPSNEVPNAVAGRLNDIDCNSPEATLTATGSAVGADISYSWTTVDGNIVSGANTSAPRVNTAGTYLLTVRREPSGCSATASVTVAANEVEPEIRITPPDQLSCGSTGIQLDGSDSDSGPDIASSWRTTNGNILSGADGLLPVVDAAGTYTLTLTNTLTGCTASRSVDVTEVISNVVAVAATPDTLNCQRGTLNLSAEGSSLGEAINYLWTTDAGNIVTGANGREPLVDAPGRYFLRVTDAATGCIARDTVRVVARLDTLSIAIEEPLPFTCVRAQMALSGSADGNLDPLLFSWSASNGGTILSGGNTAMPTVAGSGDYTLMVLNPVTGCRADRRIFIAENTTEPPAEAGEGFVLTCRNDRDTLRGLGPQTGNAYRWTTSDGHFLADSLTPRPVIDEAGTYYLSVTNLDNGCTARDSVVITQDGDEPTVQIAPAGRLDCRTERLELNAAGTDSGAGFVTRWTTADGRILSGENGLQPMVDAPGTYVLSVSNEANGCSALAEVLVRQDTADPGADAGAGGRLDCRVPFVSLRPDTSGGSGLRFVWATETGDALTGLQPEVYNPGWYYFTALNPENGCSSVDSIEVRSDFAEPEVVVGPAPAELTCLLRQVFLGNPDAVDLNFDYQWQTSNGQIVGPDYLATLPVGMAGTYTLTVTDRNNGCSADSSVVVRANQQPPLVEIRAPDTLNCANRQLRLLAESSGEALLASWSTSSGNILEGADGLSPLIDQAGTYQLRLENPANGCVDSAAVSVPQDTLAPLATIAPASVLDCRNPQLQLDAGNSSQGASITYRWSTSNGSIVSGGDSPMPLVEAAGTYALLVRNETNRCEARDSVLVRRNAAPPVLTVAQPELLTCSRASVRLSASIESDDADGLLTFWTSPDGNLMTDANSLTPTVSEPGRYRLTVSDPTNGCRAVITVTVAENRLPPVVVTEPEIDLGCERTPRTLSATATGLGPFTFNWATDDGRIIRDGDSPEPLTTGPGTYTLTVTDLGNGCVANGRVVTLQDLPEDFAISQLAPDCRVPTGTIFFGAVSGGTPPFLYSTDGGQTFRADTTFSGLGAGSYDLVVQDARGCETGRRARISPAPELELYLDARALIALGDSLRLNPVTNFPDTAFTTVSWTPGAALSCADCLRPHASPNETTVYTLTVETADGCTATDELELIVDRQRDVYFPTAFSPGGDGTNDTWVPFANAKRVSRINALSIYDRWGNAVFSNEGFAPNDASAGWDGTHQGKTMNPAVFIFTAAVEFVDGRVIDYAGEFVLLR